MSHQDLHGSAAIGLMVRRELTQLIETIERSKQLFIPLGAKFHEQEKLWRFPNGSRLRFAYLERDSDADAYQGHSYTRVYVEEIGTFPSASPILKLMATLRSGSGIPCGFRATGNPGGPGHQWVRARYIDPAPLGWKTITESFTNPWTKETVTRERVYIPSKLQDNRYLGSEYVANLQMVGNTSLVRAWLEGDWSVIEGAFFPEFSEAKHVIPPFTIPESWLRFRSCDWGSARPFSVGWWAVVGDDYPSNERVDHVRLRRQDGNMETNTQASRILPRGAIIRYREWYGASNPNVGLKLPAEDVADGIVSRETHEPRNAEGTPNITYGVIDPAAYISDGGPSIAERMARRSVLFKRADNARVAARGALGGWDQVRARLIGDGERPMIYFTSNCVDAIRTLPAMQHDTNRPEDVDSEGEDHACFAAGTIIDGLGHVEEVGQLTKTNTDVIRLSFDDGAQIVCTPNHLFMGANGKWMEAQNLKSAQLASVQQFKSSWAFDIIAVAYIFSVKVCDCIVKFGNTIEAKFPKVSISITPMKIPQIMKYQIFAFCENLNTSRFMEKAAVSAIVPERLLPHGIGVLREGHGILNISNYTFKMWWPERRKSLARFAGKLSRLALSRHIGRSIAITTVKLRHCVAVEPLKEKQNVYCLGRESGWLSVSGLIASNCDEIRYACMSRPYVKQIDKRPETKILSVGPLNQVCLEDMWDQQPTRRRQRV